MPIPLLALVVVVSSAVLTDLFTPAVIRVAGTLQAFAHPGGRHIHATKTPRLGGVAVALGVFFGCAIGWLLSMGEGLNSSFERREAAR